MMGVRVMSAAAVAVGVAALTGCGGTLWNGPTGTAGTGGAAGTTGWGGTTGEGGTTGQAGTTGGAGTTGDGGAAGTVEGGPCPATVSKGVPCGPSDVQLCYKTCGPEKVGTKSETCLAAGTYAEMSGCNFDSSRDYSCYKISTAENSMCPSGVTPQASQACDVAPCVVCNSLQGLSGGNFLDSAGAAKIGYCVCQQPNSAGVRTWSCATDTSWPCPFANGC